MAQNNKWFKKQITYLNSKIGLYKTDSQFYFEPTNEFYNSISNGDFNTINKVIQNIGNFIGCNVEPTFGGWISSKGFVIKKDNVVSSEPDKRAGYIKSEDNLNAKIYLKKKFMNKPVILSAIIAHEITHHILFEKKIIYEDKKENEIFTDIAANFFGLGKLLLNGYSNKKVGYVSYKKIANINIDICKLRNIDINILKRNLNKKATLAVNDSYSRFKRKERINQIKKNVKNIFVGFISKFKTLIKSKKKVKKNKSQDDKIVIICGKCGQKMRVPKTNKKLKIRCPNCDDKIILNPKI